MGVSNFNELTQSSGLRVCLVSPDVNGPIRNGGIGTATTALGEHLTALGHEVVVFYTLGSHCEAATIGHWVADFASRGMTLVPRPPHKGPKVEAPSGAQIAHSVFEWVNAQARFDVVVFPEWGATGYYCIEAKRSGLYFSDTQLIVVTHSPTLWHLEGNQDLLTYRYSLLTDDMERHCVAFADQVISPTAYMLDWMRARQWRISSQSIVLPNFVPLSLTGSAIASQSQSETPIVELVFFGRLEVRKGIALFCNAVSKLQSLAIAKNLKITFMGKATHSSTFDSLDFLREETAAWVSQVSIKDDFSSSEAIAYLGEPGRLAVIASLIDNAPYTVVEMQRARLCFVAARVGGIPELLHPDDHDQALFDPTATGLLDALQRALKATPKPIRARISDAEISNGWAEMLALCAHRNRKSTLAPRAKAIVSPSAGPTISVCMTHFNRPEFLKQALDGLKAQTFQDFEVILVDDGSDDAARIELRNLTHDFAQRGWKVIEQENLYLGAARNRAAAQAAGKYLLFHDDDNVALPNMLAIMLSAIEHSSSDIVTSAMSVFSKNEPPKRDALESIWLPIGAAKAFGAIENVFGDANALVRKETFVSLGGFTEIVGVGHEDWEFFAKAVLSGASLLTIPEPLFHYRVNPVGMLRTGAKLANLQRSLKPYLEGAGYPYSSLILLAQGLAVHNESHDRSLALMEEQRRVIERTIAGLEVSNGTSEEDSKTALETLKSISFALDGHRGQRISPQRLTGLAEAIFSSTTMRLTRPFRNAANKLRGCPQEPTTLPIMTEIQKLDYVINTFSSASWNITGPIRFVLGLMRRRS
jgi:O-antigen biosynthesis protein